MPTTTSRIVCDRLSEKETMDQHDLVVLLGGGTVAEPHHQRIGGERAAHPAGDAVDPERSPFVGFARQIEELTEGQRVIDGGAPGINRRLDRDRADVSGIFSTAIVTAEANGVVTIVVLCGPGHPALERGHAAAFADAVGGAAFDEAKAGEGGTLRTQSAEKLKNAVQKALREIHAVLSDEQRQRLAYLIRTGVVTL